MLMYYHCKSLRCTNLATLVHQQQVLWSIRRQASQHKLAGHLGALPHQKLSLPLQQTLRLYSADHSVEILLLGQWS